MPWLNGVLDTDVSRSKVRPEDVATWTDYTAVRLAIQGFVKAFDGSAGAGHVIAEAADGETLSDDELDELEALLRILLDQGFGDHTLSDLDFPAASLRFAVRSAGRVKPGWRDSVSGKRVRDGGTKALRSYRSSGAYVLHVRGTATELVPFLVSILLTQPDMVAVRRCARPGCEHYVIAAVGARGAPKKFCSPSCGLRNAEQEKYRLLQKNRKRK